MPFKYDVTSLCKGLVDKNNSTIHSIPETDITWNTRNRSDRTDMISLFLVNYYLTNLDEFLRYLNPASTLLDKRQQTKDVVKVSISETRDNFFSFSCYFERKVENVGPKSKSDCMLYASHISFSLRINYLEKIDRQDKKYKAFFDKVDANVNFIDSINSGREDKCIYINGDEIFMHDISHSTSQFIFVADQPLSDNIRDAFPEIKFESSMCLMDYCLLSHYASLMNYTDRFIMPQTEGLESLQSAHIYDEKFEDLFWNFYKVDDKPHDYSVPGIDSSCSLFLNYYNLFFSNKKILDSSFLISENMIAMASFDLRMEISECFKGEYINSVLHFLDIKTKELNNNQSVTVRYFIKNFMKIFTSASEKRNKKNSSNVSSLGAIIDLHLLNRVMYNYSKLLPQEHSSIEIEKLNRINNSNSIKFLADFNVNDTNIGYSEANDFIINLSCHIRNLEFEYTEDSISSPPMWLQLLKRLGKCLVNNSSLNISTNNMAERLWARLAEIFERIEVTTQKIYFPKLHTGNVDTKMIEYHVNHYNDILKMAINMESFLEKATNDPDVFYGYDKYRFLLSAQPSKKGDVVGLVSNKTKLTNLILKRFNSSLASYIVAKDVKIINKSLLSLKDLIKGYKPDLSVVKFSEQNDYRHHLLVCLHKTTSMITEGGDPTTRDNAKFLVHSILNWSLPYASHLPDTITIDHKMIDVSSLICYSASISEFGDCKVLDYVDNMKKVVGSDVFDIAQRNSYIGPVYINQFSVPKALGLTIFGIASLMGIFLLCSQGIATFTSINVPYLFLFSQILSGTVGIVYPALTIISTFLSYQLYCDIFKLKVENTTSLNWEELYVAAESDPEASDSILNKQASELNNSSHSNATGSSNNPGLDIDKIKINTNVGP
ncbi:MAG: hypothetical protein VX335_05550 [Pseudomonadota bacterium]|nr:hypothetical protein [Pseudomonadota bacterium]